MPKKKIEPAEIIRFCDGDMRLRTLYDALSAVLYERSQGLPIPAVLGILRLLECGLIENERLKV